MSTIYYRLGGTYAWQPLPEGADPAAWAYEELLKLEYKDSDNGYREFIEFFHPDNSRTYACASYASFCMDEGGGRMGDFSYGDAALIRNECGDYAVDVYPLGPNRDWIRLSGLKTTRLGS